ncbi:MAG: lytic murein transglycosylase, partial [Pseudomonadota bacterium]|nr:lytic murein transglycosylase [Pseudomonadota bacterium]
MFHRLQGRPFVVPALLFLLAACPGLGSADDGRLAAQRLTFAAAEAALRRNDTALYNRLTAQLKDYPLYPYLLYQDLKRRLDHNPAGEVQWFLDAFPDVPVAGRLRDAWLRHLAATRQWVAYRRFHRPGGTLEQDCWQRQALLAAGNSAAALEG